MDKADKDTFDGLMKVADFDIARFDQRRNYNWKVSLGFWATIIGSATLLGSGDHSITLPWQIGAACVILFLHTCWLVRVFEGDKKDKIGAFEARDIAIGLLKTKLKAPPFTVKNEKAFKDWSVQFQFATTLLLLAAIILIVNS